MDCKIIYLNEVVEGKKAMGPWRQLQVSAPQRDGVKNCAISQIEEFKKQAIEIQQQEINSQVSLQSDPMPTQVTEQEIVPEAIAVEEPVVIETPVMEPVIPTPGEQLAEQNTEVTENAIPEPVISETVIPEPTITESSVAEIPVVESPVVEPNVAETQTEIVPEVQAPQGVEIVSEAPTTSIYTELADELRRVDEDCDKRITDINTERTNRKQGIIGKYKEHMENQEREIMNLKNKAVEHVKNAQAAEQIAMAAHQNAMNISQNPAMMQPQIPNVDNVVPFQNEMPTTEIPSLDTAQVLSKVA